VNGPSAIANRGHERGFGGLPVVLVLEQDRLRARTDPPAERSDQVSEGLVRKAHLPSNKYLQATEDCSVGKLPDVGGSASTPPPGIRLCLVFRGPAPSARKPWKIVGTPLRYNTT